MPVPRPIFENPPRDIETPLLRAVFLGHTDELDRHLPDDAQLRLERWQGGGASGLSRCVLTYLATHLHHIPRRPYVPMYSHGLDRQMEPFWDALPNTLFAEALSELQDIAAYQRSDLMKYADDEGCIVGSRSYEGRQAEAIIQEMSDNPDKDVIEVPTWLLHSFCIREEFGSYGVCDHRPVQIKCKIPVADVFLSTYHIAGDRYEIGRDQFHHTDKELIVLNRSPSGRFPISRKEMRLGDPDFFMSNRLAHRDRKTIQTFRPEYLYSPIFSDIQSEQARLAELKVSKLNKLADRCVQRLRQVNRPN